MLLRLINKIWDIMLNLPHKIRYMMYSNSVEKFDTYKGFFQGEWTKVYGEGVFKVGEGSYCGARCGFSTSQGYKIEIGMNCSISHNVRIYTNNRVAQDITKEKDKVAVNYGDVIIGDNVWVGANVIILEGVTVGSNVVIGANSVVNKSIPSNVVAVGAPIRIIY